MHSLVIILDIATNRSTTVDRLSLDQAMELEQFWRGRGVLCFIRSE